MENLFLKISQNQILVDKDLPKLIQKKETKLNGGKINITKRETKLAHTQGNMLLSLVIGKGNLK